MTITGWNYLRLSGEEGCQSLAHASSWELSPPERRRVNGHEFPEGSDVLVVSVSTRPIYYTPRTEEVSAHLEVNGQPRCVVYHRSL